MEYIETNPTKRQAPRRKINIKTGKEHDAMENKKTLKQALATHRKNIKQARADIKKYRLLMKQAKLSYKLSK